MLQTISTCVKALWTTLLFTLSLSVKVGKTLVEISNILIQTLVKLSQNVLLFFGVLLESFTVFLQDIIHGVQQVLQFLINLVDNGLGIVYIVIAGFVHGFQTITRIVTGVYNVIPNGITWIINLCMWVKQLVLLFGAGVWFLLTIIPLFIVYLCTMGTYFIGVFFDEVLSLIYLTKTGVKSQARKFINFLTDASLQESLGVLVGVCSVYYCLRHHQEITGFILSSRDAVIARVTRWWPRRVNNTSRILVQSRRALPRRATTRSRSPYRSRRKNSSAMQELINLNDEEDRLCVACRDDPRSILLLPCRHLCLCRQCYLKICRGSNTCPMCRSEIDDTMLIFLS